MRLSCPRSPGDLQLMKEPVALLGYDKQGGGTTARTRAGVRDCATWSGGKVFSLVVRCVGTVEPETRAETLVVRRRRGPQTGARGVSWCAREQLVNAVSQSA